MLVLSERRQGGGVRLQMRLQRLKAVPPKVLVDADEAGHRVAIQVSERHFNETSWDQQRDVM